ncbi:MAG: CobD/CbiB family protein [Sulfuritalea sp.]|nr:CobD/CbiB family protein [Sulfuritalea sp.]
MTLLSIIIALVIEQLQPLSIHAAVRGPLRQMADSLSEKFNDGSHSHGVIAWILGVALPTALLAALSAWLMHTQALLGFLLGIGVLYLTMGFRQFSHFFTDIHLSLRRGEVEQARQILAQWRGVSGDRLTSSEVARLAIEHALLSSHRYVFAPLLWFSLFGPAGALLYRLAQLLCEYWGERTDAEIGEFGQFSRQAFQIIDWIPLRVTAAFFAIVGDFEDAVHCWRTQAVRWPEAGSGILLASGAGALGVRLGMPVHEVGQELGQEAGDPDNRPELGLGEDADPDFMQSTIGLVWRSLVLGLAVLALIWVSGWVGS